VATGKKRCAAPISATLAFRPHVPDDAELLVARHLRIDAVQLPELDALEAEAPQARLHASAQIVGAAVRNPLARAGPLEPALGRDEQAGIGMQRLADQLFADARAVAVGGVDEVYVQRAQALERAQRLGAVRWRAPDAVAGQAHGAEAKAIDLEVAGDLEAAGGGGSLFRHGDPPRDIRADRGNMVPEIPN